ncbi:MAG TPA: hypothetical protein VGP20_11110 [Steroidobacteraceae bacterium]|jgi:hypothetical protein|nr:hypothetical protein [Steroidobacteraceae bacterium]
MYGFGLRERVLLEAREHEAALAPQAQQAQPSAQASQQQAPPP